MDSLPWEKSWMKKLTCFTAALCGLGLALPAAAAPPDLDSGDTAWVLTATLLVIMMSLPGLALFYGGLVRRKNALSILLQVFAVFSLVTVLWVIYGYSLAFSGGNAVIGNLAKVALAGITPQSLSGSIPEYVFMAFQCAFAAITLALIVGSFAERVRFSAVIIFSAI